MPGTDGPARGSLAGTKLAKEEVQALLLIDGVNSPIQPAGPGLFQVLLLPHPMTTGVGRAVDLVLTAVALPLIVSGVFLLLIFGRRRMFGVLTRRLRGNVELTAALFASVLGTASIVILGLWIPLPIDVSPLIVAGVGALALLLRVFVRRGAEAGGEGARP